MRFLILLLLASCAKDPILRSSTDNKNFDVEMLFTYDGCKVYRFTDGGNMRYFTNCTAIEYSKTYACGKGRTCTEVESVPNFRNVKEKE